MTVERIEPFLASGPAMANAVSLLEQARMYAVKGGAPSEVLRGIDSTVRRLLERIDMWSSPPQLVQPDLFPRSQGWRPYVAFMNDEHWPLCFERRGGFARRRGEFGAPGHCELSAK